MRQRMAIFALAAMALAFLQGGPNDPYFGQQWGLDRIEVPQSWRTSQGQGTVVAVIDSGVDLDHPDLGGAFARRPDGALLGHDFVDDDSDPADEHGHGTMVAGIIAARTSNGTGVAGVAPRGQLMPLRVLDGQARGTTEDVNAAIRWAVDHGADVINLSLEIAREHDENQPLAPTDSDASDSAVRYAWNRGVVVVAAAGNDSSGLTDYEEDSPVVIVGASTRDDRRAGFSDTGRRDAVVAPGVEIISTWCNPCTDDGEHTYGQSEGTSYAAAYVSGAAALLRGSGMDHRRAVRRLRETAEDIGASGPDSSNGHGRINVASALGVAASPSPSPRDNGSSPAASPSPRTASPSGRAPETGTDVSASPGGTERSPPQATDNPRSPDASDAGASGDGSAASTPAGTSAPQPSVTAPSDTSPSGAQTPTAPSTESVADPADLAGASGGGGTSAATVWTTVAASLLGAATIGLIITVRNREGLFRRR